MVENYASAHERESEKVPEETLSLLRAQIMDDVSSKHKSELAALQTKVSNTVFELQQALQEKRALEFSCTELKQQNAVFQSQLNGYKAIVGCQEQQHLLTRASMQTDMVREKTKQARIATDIERVKHSEVIWKIAGGALIAITSAAITAYLKSGK
jgi:hypothetical protein